ncbi:MAG: hypothetical protein RDV41_05350 [Planctomycetota bacterium]|nr:hypothetical protein [Planctomycetota bacterium]
MLQPDKREHYVVDRTGEKTAVIVPLAKFDEMVANLKDLALVAERAKEKRVSLHDTRRRLKKDARI